MSETCIAQGLAQVMIYNNMDKQWESPAGSDGSVTTVQLLQNRTRLGFRIISRRADNAILLNSNLFQKLKYHAATNNFHQWRDEEKRVFGLSFRYEQEAQAFIDIVRQAIEQLEIAMNNGVNDYQQSAADNVYQDPHQHLMHIHSAPNFHHDENQNANFRKTSQHASTLYSASAMTQQQRRASQTSSTSAGSSAPPVAPPISNIPQAPPPPPVAGIAPVNTSSAPPPPPLPPVGAGAPPPPPPPPPPAALMAMNGAPNGVPNLAEQLKQKALRSTGGLKPNGVAVEEKPAAPKGGGDLITEMNALFNKRKHTQAKSDAVDSKSNTSNGSSDSGCGIGTNGSNGGSVGSAAAKKWSVSDGPKPLDSPKTHRKLPSASSLFPQEDSTSKPGTSMTNGTTPAPSSATTSTGVSNEQLERLRADLMVEVRLEINKLRQDLMEAQERSKQEILETILTAIGRR